MCFVVFSFLVLFIFTGGLQKAKLFATIPRVEMNRKGSYKGSEGSEACGCSTGGPWGRDPMHGTAISVARLVLELVGFKWEPTGNDGTEAMSEIHQQKGEPPTYPRPC